jgi:hypothetical protein
MIIVNKRRLLKGKRGLLYVFISCLFVVVMMIVFLAYKQYSYSDRQKVIQTRVMTVNEFIKDIDFDSKRVIYISAFRSLIALEDHVARSGHYINNSEELFRVAFYNGTVNGTAVDILVNSTYLDYLQRLNTISRQTGINVDINVTDITLYHDSPWSVNVVVTTHVNVTDSRGLARWEFDKDYETSVNLTNIRDPVYSVSTYGRVPNTIRRTNISDSVFVVGDNDTTGLMTHINNSYYHENALAPSFLMRLAGNFSASPFGIESLVNIQELIIQGVDYNSSRSVVDYIIFANATAYNRTWCDVENMPGWFRIDINHTATYEIDGLAYNNCTG